MSNPSSVLALALVLLSVSAGVSGGACGGEQSASSGAAARPEPIAEHDCASCGMIVREQPSPRGQVVHRDGTHEWFCSIADVVAYVGAPSPHGRIEHVWVETQAVDVDPAANATADLPWMPAADAFFVLGVERERVMGPGVLVFASEADARSAAERLHGRMARWDEVVTALGGTP